MKILVFSDSHGRLGLMVKAMEEEHPQRVFFLGDYYRDGQTLAKGYPHIPINMVKGNGDWCAGPEELEVEVGGIRFLLTHGHQYGVKHHTGELVKEGRRRGVHMVCFGHTHQGMNRSEEGLWLFNPGTAGGVRNREGYGVLTIEEGQVRGDLR